MTFARASQQKDPTLLTSPLQDPGQLKNQFPDTRVYNVSWCPRESRRTQLDRIDVIAQMSVNRFTLKSKPAYAATRNTTAFGTDPAGYLSCTKTLNSRTAGLAIIHQSTRRYVFRGLRGGTHSSNLRKNAFTSTVRKCTGVKARPRDLRELNDRRERIVYC
jgi:hypothetical protein